MRIKGSADLLKTGVPDDHDDRLRIAPAHDRGHELAQPRAAHQEAYIRGCKKLAAFLGRSPDAATAEDIRLFQLHLAEQGVSNCTRNRTMTGIAFLFRVTLRRPEIADQIEYIAEPQKIPLVLSPEEVRRLLEAAPGFKSRLLLSLTYGCGLRASEVVLLKVCDIDSAQMVIRIEQGKGRKDRYVMLPPALLDMLREWWKAARPQGWPFPGRPRGQSADVPAAQSHLPSGGRGCRDQEGRNAAHLAAQLCHPPAREQAGYPDDPGSARPQATDTMAHYTCVATDRISRVVSPLDQLGNKATKDEPPK